MSDLEPWKIWAVTVALVCAILGTTAARVRPLVLDEASAQAAVATSGELAASITTSAPDSTEFDAYPSYTPHRSYGDAGYAPVQASTIVPTNSPLYGNGVSSALQTEYYQEPAVDVTRELIGNQGSQSDLIAADNNQITNYPYRSPLYSVDYTRVSNLATDGWVSPPVTDDLAFNTTFDVASPDGDGVFVEDSSGTNDARMYDFALQNAIINVAMNHSDLNEAAPLVLSLRSDDPNLVARSLAIASQAENPDQNLAMYGELDTELGDELGVEQEVLDEARSQAMLAEERELAQAQAEEAQAQLQAARQLRDEAVYTANVGKIYWQIDGSRFTALPQ